MRPVHALVLLALIGCDSDECGTFDPVEKRLTIETPADPALELRIESCRLDVDACPMLCTLALERLDLISFDLDSCRVGFAGPRVLLDVVYTPTTNCGFDGDFGVARSPGGT